jgi:molecular chaperone DnaK (HSP70)
VASLNRAIGVDFGTSTSLAAEGDATRGVTLAPLGRTTMYMPTLIGVTPDRLIAGDMAGDLAENQIIRSIKRQITENGTTLPHPMAPGAYVDVDEAIVLALRQLATNAREAGVELNADTIRLGCPAMWNAGQRARLLRLAQRAGIPVAEHTLIDEPIAAGMAWLSSQLREQGAQVKGRLLVFDMGGGTLDVALLQVDTTSGDHSGEISVLASKGVNQAGDALDDAIQADLLSKFEQYELDLTEAQREELARKLLPEARLAKVMLSSQDEVHVRVSMEPLRIPAVIYTREELEAAFASQLDAAEALTWSVVRESFLTHEAHRSPEELRRIPSAEVARGVTRVLLAGGMSRVPAVRDRLERMFPNAEIYDRAGRRVGPDEAIVAGLAETTVYDRVNLHRPPFDFLLELPSGQVVRLYSAHSPLYEGWLALQRSVLYYERVVATRDLPTSGRARLIARSSMGSDVSFRLDSAASSGIDVELGHADIRFRIYPNGVISISDGRGHARQFRVNRWPVLRGKDHAVIQMERYDAANRPRRAHAWENDPLFLH